MPYEGEQQKKWKGTDIALVLLALGAAAVVATTVIGGGGLLVLFSPLLLLFSPILVPLAIFLTLAGGGVAAAIGTGLAGIAAAAWIYNYIQGRHPIYSDKVDEGFDRAKQTAHWAQQKTSELTGLAKEKGNEAYQNVAQRTGAQGA